MKERPKASCSFWDGWSFPFLVTQRLQMGKKIINGICLVKVVFYWNRGSCYRYCSLHFFWLIGGNLSDFTSGQGWGSQGGGGSNQPCSLPRSHRKPPFLILRLDIMLGKNHLEVRWVLAKVSILVAELTIDSNSWRIRGVEVREKQ